MLAWIRKRIAPPKFEGDEDKTRVAALLNTILWSLLLLAIVSIPPTIVINLDEPEDILRDTMFSVVFVVVAVAGLFMMHRGLVNVASATLIALLYIAFTVLIVEAGGVVAPLFSVYLVLIIITSMLFTGPQMLYVAGLVVLTSLGMYILQWREVIAIQSTRLTPAWITYGLIIAFAAALLYRSGRSVRAALSAQRVANLELQTMRDTLEQRVAARTRELERRATYLEAIVSVAREAASMLDQQALLTRVANLISEQFGFYQVGLFLTDPTGEWAVLQAASSEGGQRMLARGHRLRVGRTGLVGYVSQYGVPRIALDVGDDAVFFENPDLPETRSAITLPLRVRGEVIGALDVQSNVPAAFSDEDVTVLQSLADQVAVAIDNAQLLNQAQTSLAAERRAYGEQSREAWAELLRARPDLGYRSDEQGLHTVTGAWAPTLTRARQSDQPQQHEDGTLLIPVRSREGTLGVIRLRKPQGAAPWLPEEIDLMESLTEQMSVALESARLFQDSRVLAAQERLVSETTAHIRETLDINLILETAAREMRQMLDLEEAEVRLTAPAAAAAAATDVEDTAAAETTASAEADADTATDVGGTDDGE